MINLNNLGAKQVAVVGTIANDLKNLNNNTANLITMESENQVDYLSCKRRNSVSIN